LDKPVFYLQFPFVFEKRQACYTHLSLSAILSIETRDPVHQGVHGQRHFAPALFGTAISFALAVYFC